eukprot:tig00001229_g7856.t1
MPFGQVVVGPPGSGKSTYCAGALEVLQGLKRPAAVVNLDPANDNLRYECSLDVRDLVRLEDAMDSQGLGPNGGIVFCMEYLESNIDWLEERLAPLQGKYILFDMPGQVELYTHHGSTKRILRHLERRLNYRICAMHLVDSYHCNDSAKYISVLLLSLSTMLHLELPHINVFSKTDLLNSMGTLDFSFDFYREVQDLSYLLQSLDVNPLMGRFSELNKALVSLVEDFGLVAFETLNVTDKESVLSLIRAADRAVGNLTVGSGD